MFRRVCNTRRATRLSIFTKVGQLLRLSDAFALDQILRTKQVVQIGERAGGRT